MSGRHFPGQNGCPRRRAYRRGTEEAVKPHSLFCNSVQVGRIKLRCPGAVHRPGALIVCQNHDNIRFFPCFFHIIRFSFLLLCFCFLILCIDCLKDLFTALTSPGLAQLLSAYFLTEQAAFFILIALVKTLLFTHAIRNTIECTLREHSIVMNRIFDALRCFAAPFCS